MEADDLTVEDMETLLGELYREKFGGSLEELRYSKHLEPEEEAQVSCKPYMGAYHVVEGSKLPEGRSPRGWRGYKPDLWRDQYECCSVTQSDAMEIHNCQRKIRIDYRNWESGRMADVLNKLHNALIRFDPDELRDFNERYPGVLQLVNEFAVIEELYRLQASPGKAVGTPREP